MPCKTKLSASPLCVFFLVYFWGREIKKDRWIIRRGTGLPNPSRDTKFSGANADREIFIFPVQLTMSRIGNLSRPGWCWSILLLLLDYMFDFDHTYIQWSAVYYCRDLDPCWFEYRSGLSPWCDPLTFVPLCDHKRDWHLIGLWLTCCVAIVSSLARTIRWTCESTTTTTYKNYTTANNCVWCDLWCVICDLSQVFLTLRLDGNIDWPSAAVVAPLLGWVVMTLLVHVHEVKSFTTINIYTCRRYSMGQDDY